MKARAGRIPRTDQQATPENEAHDISSIDLDQLTQNLDAITKHWEHMVVKRAYGIFFAGMLAGAFVASCIILVIAAIL